MTYVLFFVIGLSGGSATFASEPLCKAAGEQLIKQFRGPDTPVLSTQGVGLRVSYFCQLSGFRAP